MSRTLHRSLAVLVAATSFQSLPISGGTARAQGTVSAVQIFEEPPPLELLRGIMIPESRSGSPTRRIVITQPDRLAPSVVAEPEQIRGASADAAAVTREQRPRPRPMAESGPIPAAARTPAAVAQTTAPAVPASAAAPREAAAGAGVVGFRINFPLDSAVVPASAYPFVDRLGELLREQPQMKLRVEGHTDALGSDEYNLLLSTRRAAAVVHALAQRQGIDPARLVILGKGEAEPLVENPFDARNRRVQFLRVG
jgi:outer membrane protein OmpA-like peptidoglycan-associated protein